MDIQFQAKDIFSLLASGGLLVAAGYGGSVFRKIVGSISEIKKTNEEEHKEIISAVKVIGAEQRIDRAISSGRAKLFRQKLNISADEMQAAEMAALKFLRSIDEAKDL